MSWSNWPWVKVLEVLAGWLVHVCVGALAVWLAWAANTGACRIAFRLGQWSGLTLSLAEDVVVDKTRSRLTDVTALVGNLSCPGITNASSLVLEVIKLLCDKLPELWVSSVERWVTAGCELFSLGSSSSRLSCVRNNTASSYDGSSWPAAANSWLAPERSRWRLGGGAYYTFLIVLLYTFKGLIWDFLSQGKNR